MTTEEAKAKVDAAPGLKCPYCGAILRAKLGSIHQSDGSIPAYEYRCDTPYEGSHFVRTRAIR